MKISSLIGLTAMVALTSATYQPVVGKESAADEDQFGAIENENDVLEVVHEEEHAEEKHEAEHEGEHASEHHDEPHEEHGMFGIPWAAPDFVTGLLMGAYGPVNARTRGGDCFSQWYDWGVSSIELSNFFTRPFNARDWRTWTRLAIKGTMGIVSTYFVWDRCVMDLDEAKELHWNHYYGFKSEDISMPHVKQTSGTWGEEQDDEAGFTAGMVVALIVGAINIWLYIESGYYYWGLGTQIGYWISNLIVAIDYWADTELFHPEPAWLRYLPEGETVAHHL